MKQGKNNFFRRNLAPIISIIAIVLATIILILFGGEDSETNSKYLKKISYQEVINKFDNKEDFILYVGQEGCSACKLFNPNFIKVIDKNKVTVYYLDLSTIKNDEYNNLQNYILITGTPTVVFITDGEEESVNNRITNGSVSTTYIYDKLKVNGYIK